HSVRICICDILSIYYQRITLPEDRFKYLVRRIGMRCLTPAELEVVRLGINPMIQPEPEDLPKDNPKLEIAVLSITDIKSVLTRKGLDIFCQKFHIPEDVHPQLPSPNQTIHEMPVGKIGVYTRFFEYANFRLPLSTFLVNILSKRPDSDAVSSFPWHANKNVSKDPFPKSTEFNADHFATLVAHPAPFRKYPKPFLCLVGMSRYYTLDEETYPRACGSAKSELEASVEKLFDEGGSTEQGDSVAGGGQDAEIELVTAVEDIAARNVTVERLKRPCKKRPAATDASGSSHPPKKLRWDYGTSGEVVIGAMPTLPFVTSSVFATPEREGDALLDSVTRGNLRSFGQAVRFVISSDSSHHSSTNASGAGVDYVIKSDVPPPMTTEAVITTSVVNVPLVPIPRVADKVTPQVQQSIFHESSFADTIRPDDAGPSHLPEKELSMGSREVDSENLHDVFVPHWNIPNDALLDDLDTSKEFINHLAPPVLFAQIRDMDYEELFTKFSVGTARQACLSAEARMRTKYSLSERKRLESESTEAARLRIQVFAVEIAANVHVDELNVLKQKNVALEDEKNSLNEKIIELQSSVSAKDLELKDLNVVVSSLRSQNDGLVDQERIEEFQDAQMKIVDDNVAKLDADLLEMACHLEEKFYPYILTTISGRRWLLTHGLKLVLVKCLNSSEYLTALGTAISRAIKQGMQSGLAAGIDHGKKGRSLTDVVAYNPDAEADFNSALQKLREVDFPLLTELKSHKDASVEDIMNLLRLESPLADAPGMIDLQMLSS
ncbi:hypothetical protein Tco_0322504, partial [Tanacetum coccineum]